MTGIRPTALRRLLGGLLLLAGCEGGPTQLPAPVATVEVDPGDRTMVVGESVQFEVVLRDSSGAILDGNPVLWRVLHPGGAGSPRYATISSTGLVTAVGTPSLGSATVEVHAVSEGVTGAARVLIIRRPDRLEVLGTRRILVGREARLHAAAVDDFGYAIADLPPPSWISSDPDIVEVSPSGVVKAMRSGSASISATAVGAQGVVEIQVVERGYSLTPLLGPDGAPVETTVAGINDHGQVAGTFRSPSGARHAFLWEGGVMRDLGTGDVRSVAHAINDLGHVAGSAGGAGGADWPAVWVDGRLARQLEADGVATAINDEGVAVAKVGLDWVLWAEDDTTALHPEGRILQVLGINNSLSAVGVVCATGEPCQAAVFVGETATKVSYGGAGSVATAIDDAGTVVGYELHGGRPERTCAPHRSCGFRWSSGERIYLGSLGPWQVTPTAINDVGQIVGTDGGRGFLWEEGAIAELTALVRGGGWEVLGAQGINEQGQIVGHARDTTTGRDLGVVLTPEP